MIFRAAQQIVDRATRHVLAHDVGLAALFADIVDADDVRIVAQLAHRARLAADTLASGGVEALGFDQRECDIAIDLVVVREKDGLAAAFADQPNHLVAAVDEGFGAREDFAKIAARPPRESIAQTRSARRRTNRRI